MATTIYLIRHGQSTFNALFDVDPVDPLHFDARLSPKGIQQVEAARHTVSNLQVDLIVVSPLTRAIETAVGMFSGAATSMIVFDLLREQLGNSCDVGRSPTELAAEFPMLDFDHLDDPWWHNGEKDHRGVPAEPTEHVDRRVAEFSKWISERPESSIAAVGHGEFFRRLTGTYLKNCEVMEWHRRHPG